MVIKTIISPFQEQSRHPEATPTTVVDPNLIRKFINQWILNPNFLSSSNQFEKNYFVKSCLVHLITSKLCDPNDCFTYYTDKNQLVSNNLLNHCIHLVGLCKSGYQLEVIYDLTRTLIQYGADPNLDPYGSTSPQEHNTHPIHEASSHFMRNSFVDASTCPHQRLRRNWSILTHLCKSVQISPTDPSIITDLITRTVDDSVEFLSLPVAQNIYHYNHEHKKKRALLQRSSTCLGEPASETSNYFNDKFTSMNMDIARELDITQKKNTVRSHSPVMLLTPAPSYERCLATSYYQNSSANIVVDSRLLLLTFYKNFIKLLYDAMDTYSIHKCLKYSGNRHEDHFHHSKNYNHHHHHHHHHHSRQHNFHNNHTNSSLREMLYSESARQSHGHNFHHQSQSIHMDITLEPLGEYLERLASTPRTLKSITRRNILSLLAENSGSGDGESECMSGKTTLIANQIHQLELPKKLKDFLLFIE